MNREFADIYTISFFGHRDFDEHYRVENQIERLLDKIVKRTPFIDILIGRSGEFDRCIASLVRRLKKQKYEYTDVNLILVLPYFTAEYTRNEDAFHSYYDDVEICPLSFEAHFKAAIQIRNRDMVDRSDLVICYINRKSGGAYQTVQYAKQLNKKIFNLSRIKND